MLQMLLLLTFVDKNIKVLTTIEDSNKTLGGVDDEQERTD